MAKKFGIKEAWLLIDGKEIKLEPSGIVEIGSSVTEDDAIGGNGNKEKIEELKKNLIE